VVLNGKAAPDADRNARFGALNIIALVVGIPLQILVIVAAFMPSTPA
jgi:hypothetical protein